MLLSRKLLILIIIIIFSYVLYLLLKQRRVIMAQISAQTEIAKEGFSSSDRDYKFVLADISGITINAKEYPNKINNMLDSYKDLTLDQFCIKASFDSAYSGKYISDTMVKYVLSRGCRFVDFSLFPSTEEGRAYVGYSDDPIAVNSSAKNTNPFYFSTMLTSVLANAFANGQVPNPNDPLFIHLRFPSGMPKHDLKPLYKSVQNDIQSVYNSGYSDFFYVNKVTKRNSTYYDNIVNNKTRIRDIQRKAVIIIENLPELNLPRNNSSSMTDNNFYNMLSNTNILGQHVYSQINPDKFIAYPPSTTSNSKVKINAPISLNMLVPDANAPANSQGNPNIHSAIKDYGIQINSMKYYLKDMWLIENETMFANYNAGILPMSLMLSYIKDRTGPVEMAL